MKRLVKKIIFYILNPLFNNNKYIYINPTFLGGLIDLMYLSTVKRDFKIIIDPIELHKRNRLANIKIFEIAYFSIMEKKINFFFNFLYYLYYKSNLYTKNINNILITGYIHRDNKIYKNLSKKNNSYFDIYESKSNDDYINQIIKKKYLLFSCRDGAYKKESLGKINTNYHSYRNESFTNYEKALSKFYVKDFNIIRFGSKAEKKCNNENIFDYTFSEYRNQTNDLFLMKNCEIYIGTGSGPDILAINFQKPLVYINWIHPSNLFTFQNNVVVIFKKVFDKREKKFISYKKLLDPNFKFKGEETPVGMFDQTNQYKKFSLELVENTDDEIFNAINEMIKFRKGEFKFDKNLQNKFKIPFTKETNNSFAPNFFVSEYFIKKNLELFN